eukprot:TRINITY_DN25169_c0_g1_i4.p1 TRINITY_DN25169_c0_g1~~TRINITY_DN25169_c0_g1_i4.p1  ORF type:complete len:259 (+),score=33.26 TRINITY_DN25169_c0_g1_i4:433-1209(+)
MHQSCVQKNGDSLAKENKRRKTGWKTSWCTHCQYMQSLQSYYRNAIMQNLDNLEKRKEAMWASFLHCSSTDDKPQHENCPQGPESWCFYNKAIAMGQRAPAHKQNVGTPLAQNVAQAIKPIYDRMSQNTLLERIQHGKTQNANECVNGQIWARCPKTVHVGVGRINAAVSSAVSHFNQGCSHLAQVMRELGVSPVVTLNQYQEKQDRKRCIAGDAVSRVETKRNRKVKRTHTKNSAEQSRERGRANLWPRTSCCSCRE